MQHCRIFTGSVDCYVVNGYFIFLRGKVTDHKPGKAMQNLILSTILIIINLSDGVCVTLITICIVSKLKILIMHISLLNKVALLSFKMHLQISLISLILLISLI